MLRRDLLKGIGAAGAVSAVGTRHAAAQDVIKIAAGAPLTGPLAKQGQEVANAVKLAVEEWNAKGGVLGGRKFTVVAEDDACDPKQAGTTAQKIALLWQQPVCTREGCGRRVRLQYDHRDEWRNVHCTEVTNLDPLCPADHHLKTHQGWALVAGTGTRPMVPPDHPDHPRNANSPPDATAEAS